MKKILSTFLFIFFAFFFASCSMDVEGNSSSSSGRSSDSVQITSRDIEMTSLGTEQNYKNMPFFFRAVNGKVRIRLVKVNDDVQDLPELEYSKSASSLKYKTLSPGSPNDMDTGSIIELDTEECVYIRAKLNVTNKNKINSDAVKFEILYGDAEVCGNIMSLYTLAYKIMSSIQIPEYFKGLFKDNTSIVSAAGLSLPSESLSKGIYESMFEGCSALKYPPKIEATALAENCYKNMFKGCSSLKYAPDLYASNTQFKNCYESMFEGCSNLSSITVNFTKWYDDNTIANTLNWVKGVAPTGKFNALSDLEIERGDSRVPEGWEIVEIKPITFDNPMDPKGWVDTTSVGDWNADPKKMPLAITANGGKVNISLVADKPKAGTLLLCYTRDKQTWYPISIENKFFGGLVTPTKIEVNDGETIYIKGYAKNNLESSYLRFKMSEVDEGSGAKVSLGGNVMSLYVNINFHALKQADAECFRGLFSGCTLIEDASELQMPASQLSELCYAYMFENCENLTKAPALPATRLAKSCYAAMFSGCKSLTEAPVLNAKSVGYTSYALMFENCENLTKAPALPATELDTMCYANMFEGCKMLVDAPSVLPATELHPACYSHMFSRCESLKKAPKLPAVNAGLSGYCYFRMFEDCINLTELPELNSTDLSLLPKNPHMLDVAGPISCYDHMFAGCNSITRAPELVAMKLSPKCYEGMFQDCENLTGSPMLPATGLATACYMNMFKGCTSLVDAPVLPAKYMANHCYHGMFKGCTSLVDAPALSSIFLADSCYGEMFANTSLVKAPELPATRLTEYAYWRMFEGCESIKEIKVHFTKWSYATHDWLWSDSDNGTFYCPSTLAERTTDRNDSTVRASWVIKDIDNVTEYVDKSADYVEKLSRFDDIPLRITAIASETGLTITKRSADAAAPSLEYSFDNSSWQPITIADIEEASTKILIPEWESVYIRAANGVSNNINNSIVINTTAKIKVSGAVASLISGNNYNATLSGDNLFASLFAQSNVFDASDLVLPAIELSSKNVFDSMFAGCLELVKAPVLPYTTVGEAWFKGMFKDCLRLLQTPSLPATVLAVNCYESMFEGCKALKKAPALPATELEDYCYQAMFKDCYALNGCEVDGKWELNSDFLPQYAYFSMFENCKSLKETPYIDFNNTYTESTKSSQWAMGNMFKGCIRLVIAHDLPNKRLSGLRICSSMFEGCTSLKKAPALPSEQLGSSTYNRMFKNCTSLVEAPALPAKSLWDDGVVQDIGSWTSCYEGMFEGCTSLKKAPALPATKLAFDCYKNMFRGCTSLISAPELNATSLVSACYLNMFKDCTSLKKAPVLAIESVSKDKMAYNGMFDGCTSLEYIEVGFKSWDDENKEHGIPAGQQTETTAGFTVNWVRGVPEGGVFVCPAELKQKFCTGNTYKGLAKSWGLTTATPHYIPEGWTVKIKSETV